MGCVQDATRKELLRWLWGYEAEMVSPMVWSDLIILSGLSF